jgi:hypothetical protein
MAEKREKSAPESAPRKLTKNEIAELLKKYPGVKLSDGGEFFMIEHKNEKGEWFSTDMIPVWEKIPRKDVPAVPIEEELKSALEKGKG